MKSLLILLFLLFGRLTLQARTFSYGVFVHRVNDRVTVDIYPPLGDNKIGLSIVEATAFLKSAPRSRGSNQIGVFEEGCNSSDYADLLKTIIDGQPEMVLTYFGGFDSDRLRKFIEQQRKAAHT